MSDEFESEMDAILLEQLINWCEFNEMNWHRALARLVNDRDRLRAERDEARREVCELSARCVRARYFLQIKNPTHLLPKDVAKSRGWECFNEVKP